MGKLKFYLLCQDVSFEEQLSFFYNISPRDSHITIRFLFIINYFLYFEKKRTKTAFQHLNFVVAEFYFWFLLKLEKNYTCSTDKCFLKKKHPSHTTTCVKADRFTQSISMSEMWYKHYIKSLCSSSLTPMFPPCLPVLRQTFYIILDVGLKQRLWLILMFLKCFC